MSQLFIHNKISKRTGFTLVELVIVIIVLGVLSAVAIPKLTSKSAFEEYTVQDQLISALRLVQLQGMNAAPDPDPKAGEDIKVCYWLVVKNGCFYQERTNKINKVCQSPSEVNVCGRDDYNQFNSVSFSKRMLANPAKYRFNLGDGKLSADSSSSPIRIFGENHLTVTINSEGYISEGRSDE